MMPILEKLKPASIVQQLEKSSIVQKAVNAADVSVIETTHPHYRTAIGVLGVLLPLAVIVRSQEHLNSISAYYFTSARDWFVGTLWVLGIFLLFYRTRPPKPKSERSELLTSGAADAFLGKAAGLSAIVVSLFPTNPPATLPSQPPEIGMLHGIAAAVLFICLSLFPLLLFDRYNGRRSLYRNTGRFMLGLVGFVFAYAVVFPESLRVWLAPYRPVFYAEAALIAVFGVSWFMRGVGLAREVKETPPTATAATPKAA